MDFGGGDGLESAAISTPAATSTSGDGFDDFLPDCNDGGDDFDGFGAEFTPPATSLPASSSRSASKRILHSVKVDTAGVCVANTSTTVAAAQQAAMPPPPAPTPASKQMQHRRLHMDDSTMDSGSNDGRNDDGSGGGGNNGGGNGNGHGNGGNAESTSLLTDLSFFYTTDAETTTFNFASIAKELQLQWK
jgi:hypothetical protein